MANSKKTGQQPSLRNLVAGDVLFREGEVGDFAYQIVKGKIDVAQPDIGRVGGLTEAKKVSKIVDKSRTEIRSLSRF